MAELPTVEDIFGWMTLHASVVLATCETGNSTVRRELISRLQQSAALLHQDMTEALAMAELLEQLPSAGWDHKGGES